MSTATSEPPQPGQDNAPAPAGVPLNYQSSGQKLWRVGTLTYTAAGLVALFCWLLWGDFAFSMRDRSVGPVLTKMLTIFGASNTVLSVLLTTVPAAIGLFLVPIISYKSDRYRSRWGRRIPFLLIPTPLAALGMIGVAYSPNIGHMVRPLYELLWSGVADIIRALPASVPWIHAFDKSVVTANGAVVATICITWTLFEVCAIIAAAVVGALINDVVPREMLGRFFGLFRVISLFAGILFNMWIFGHVEEHFQGIFLSIAILYGVGFSIMCLKVKEGHYPPPEDHPEDIRAKGFLGAVKIYFRECFSQRYYLWVFAAMLVAGLTFIPFNTFAIPYASAVHMKDKTYGDLVAYSYMVSLVLAYPLGWVVDKLHSLRVGIAALLLYAVSVAYGSLFVHDARTFGIALVAHTILSGTYFTATACLGQVLFPRLKFAQFASAAFMVGQIGSMALGFIIGPILDHSHSNYRLTFIAGLILCLAGLALMLVVYKHFMALGGPHHYVAPGDVPVDDPAATVGPVAH